jgi:hypothetical protein
MLNLDREVTPEDFAPDHEKIYWQGPDGDAQKKRDREEREELRRLYHIQEDLKAKAHAKREEARKDAIPFSEALALEICHRVSAGEFLINICKDGAYAHHAQRDRMEETAF